MDPSKKKLLFRSAIVVGIICTILLVVLINHRSKNQTGYDNRYYDKYSGKTLSDINDKSPEKAGTPTDQPIFLGFDTLLDYGYTQYQVANLQGAINQYIVNSKITVKHVSFDATAFKKNDAAANDPTNTIVKFNVVFNFEDIYAAELESAPVELIKLRLKDSTGKEVFSYDDSQNVDESGRNAGN